MGRSSASGTEFYRLGEHEGPYTSLKSARGARTAMYSNAHPSRWPKIQKLEAYHEHSGYGPCYATLEWVYVEE